MEDITEILENAVIERLEMAYFALIKENMEVKQGVESVKELSIKLYENTNIPKEVRRQIEDYKDISHFVEREMQKFVYMEGIKDGIKLLRELGVLR
ncbi:hypothetical protein ONV75_16190 [Clostridium sp. LQ25]|uniref:hypothetical protein n=1 Tax=Clostridium sp. LQ25 TaxID=2992805 RepID=UPI002258F91B|nr:hypothetical protein [Clostridium sp. LQ25]MDU5722165.1 hypothetical protein [Clostridium butyricum]MDU5820386.1 hypothetical protein [Clostridium butyricum]UZT06120.1 hypothetical protein ONV75_16190 [Clostridium sp. LQ25]